MNWILIENETDLGARLMSFLVPGSRPNGLLARTCKFLANDY